VASLYRVIILGIRIKQQKTKDHSTLNIILKSYRGDVIILVHHVGCSDNLFRDIPRTLETFCVGRYYFHLKMEFVYIMSYMG
jgi:hypothetical protein